MLDSSSTTNSDKATNNSAAFPDPLPTGCALTQTNQSVPFPTAAIDLESFFIIQSKALWLPKKPNNPNGTIAGVDTDGDCVRDDIEHYIARKYGARSQYKLRKYLYEYTAWMDTFLIQNIGISAARYASNQMAEAGECVNRIIGKKAAKTAIDDLFAKFHNTFPRSWRYLDNLPRLGGWTTRENIGISCP